MGCRRIFLSKAQCWNATRFYGNTFNQFYTTVLWLSIFSRSITALHDFYFWILLGRVLYASKEAFILPVLILIQKNTLAVTYTGEASYPVTVSSLHMKREILLICYSCQEMRFELNKAKWQAESNHMKKKRKKKRRKRRKRKHAYWKNTSHQVSSYWPEKRWVSWNITWNHETLR